jgi:hypothetical protein
MKPLVFRLARWLACEGVVLAAFLSVLVVVTEPLWRALGRVLESGLPTAGGS